MSNTFKPVSLGAKEFVCEVARLVEEASRRGIVLRVLGSVAIYIHSMHDHEAINIYSSIARLANGSGLFMDLDLAAYSKQRRDVMNFFESEKGFSYDIMLRALYGYKRLIYFHPAGLYYVDIFFDKLEFNHDVVWGSRPGRGRLELDYPTMSLTDLALGKLQITKITRKDLIDLAVLLKAHDICIEESKECINGDYIATILSDDWGFWYDATNNLRKLIDFANSLAKDGRIPSNVANTIASKASKLLSIIDSKPKTKKWISRSRIGTSKPWYREVEEVVR